jgi:transcriptional regulator with XRE-family HTH domain
MSALELKQICDIMETKLNRIKVVLVEKSISQKELAAKIGKSFSTVNAYCANRQQPTLETLDQIAHVLNVPMRTLIKED